MNETFSSALAANTLRSRANVRALAPIDESAKAARNPPWTMPVGLANRSSATIRHTVRPGSRLSRQTIPRVRSQFGGTWTRRSTGGTSRNVPAALWGAEPPEIRGARGCVMLVAVGPEELGRQLRRARQHLGLSLRDVHAVTAIPLVCLAALEEGDLAQLPSPVYARGYIRSYAEAMRLDGDRLALELWRCMEEAPVTASGGAPGPGPRPRGRSALPTAQRPPTRPAPRQRSRPTNGQRP